MKPESQTCSKYTNTCPRQNLPWDRCLYSVYKALLVFLMSISLSFAAIISYTASRGFGRFPNFCETQRQFTMGASKRPLSFSLFHHASFLSTFSHRFIDSVRIPFDDGINDCPNQQITNQKNSGKHQDRRCTPIQPIVNQISEQVADIQHTAVNGYCCHKGQPLDLIDNIHAACDKSKGR